ncbi:MAG: hypothetical protein JSS27_03135 [Planctomycetes bacterium]|nr:hypothetical protein [Planctomycetota bacterium]
MTDSADHEPPATPRSSAEWNPRPPSSAGGEPPRPASLDAPAETLLPPVQAEIVEPVRVHVRNPYAPRPGASHQSLPPDQQYAQPRQRRLILPLVLFLVTCLSTFWAGAAGSEGPEGPMIAVGLPIDPLYVLAAAVETVADHWHDGLMYMLAVMAILLAHEMGHFIQAVRHRVPASLPYFIPMPISPLGTMGALIAMRGSQADRRQLFDIGISGPIAGLLVALPVAWIGIAQSQPGNSPMIFNDPLVLKWMVHWLHPNLGPNDSLAWNPLYMAGWVGMLITGLNMMPISQLDGGHVAYALFGRGAHWLARGLVVAAGIAMAISQQPTWIVMLALVMLIGTDHPRTANDAAPIGWFRRMLGLASLLIPLVCFVPVPISGN